MALGFSLTINDIHNTTRAAVEDSGLNADGPITVSADSDAQIDAIAFGISVGVAISGNALSVSVGATGALGFNTIDNTVEATIHDTSAAGTSSVIAGGPLSVTANDDQRVSKIELSIDGQQVALANASTLSYVWNSGKGKGRSSSIVARAQDAAGNATSTSVSVKRR